MRRFLLMRTDVAKPETKRLRAIGHKLKSIVTIADKGITENVLAEVNRALADHELIKITVRCPDRDAKRELIKQVVSQCNAELIQTAGHVALIFKAAKQADPRLSNILRNL